ncbi:transglutaminase-like domain-containing protein [Desulfobacula sp.]
MEQYLKPTYYIDSDNPQVIEFVAENSESGATKIENAVSLYYAVRDGIRYNPYSMEPSRKAMKASAVLKRGNGYCVAKAVLLAACARSLKIPARLGFADVKNHLNTKRLMELMGTDVFIYHGYTELLLNNKWLKATPAFNLELCNNFNVRPLKFDGLKDSIFHPFDRSGNRHMEYVRDHGSFADLPWQTILDESKKIYPLYFKDLERRSQDFSAEALKENQ